MTSDGATVSSSSPILEVHEGRLDAQLGAVETILKSRSGDLILNNLGATDAAIVIREGRVERGASSLGSDVGGVIVDAVRGASLALVGERQIFADPVELRNATGVDGRGGLILEGEHGQLRGTLELGDGGSTLRVDTPSEFTIAGEIRGGDLKLIGDGTLRLSNDVVSYTGRTIIGQASSGRPVLSIAPTSRLVATSAIELVGRGVLELDKRQLATAHEPLS